MLFVREKYQDSLDWSIVFDNQKLSEQFIEKYKNKISYWGTIFRKQKLSKEFKEKYKNKLKCYERYLAN